MHFGFTEEQDLFQRTVRQFAKEVLLPKYTLWDKNQRWPAEMILKMGELGLTGLGLPEKYGGTPTDMVTLGIVAEEVGRGDFSCAAIVGASQVLGTLIARHATAEMKERYLPPIVRGEMCVGLALTEPQCGSDAMAITTRAIRDGDHYVITGEKSSSTMAGQVPVVLLFAKTDPSAGARGVSAFLLPIDSPGLGISNFNDLGIRGLRRGALHLDGVRLPAQNLIGEEGKGFFLMANQFDHNRGLIGLACVGLAEQTLEETIAYVKTRTAFGRPVAQYQGIAFPIVEAATQLEACRLLSYKVLWLRDRGLPHAKEAAMVKGWAPRLAFRIVHQLLLCYGHAGYSDDYPVGQRLRDVVGYDIADGTHEIMNLMVARETFGRACAP